MLRTTVISLLVASASGAAISLDPSNFEDVVFNSGKNAFVKFQAPWWGHCKKMKPAWDQLADEFAESAVVVVADVDCTIAESKPLCGDYGVKGFPTIKYWNADSEEQGDAYKSGRDLSALKAHVEEHLSTPRCSAAQPELCSEEQKTFLAELASMSAEAQTAELEKLKGEIANAVLAHDKAVNEAAATLKDIKGALSPKISMLKTASAQAATKDEL